MARRLLFNCPVTASPPSASTRLTVGLRRFWALCFIAASLLAILAGVIWIGWMSDKAILRRQTHAAIGGARNPAEIVVALNHWVYGHRGFAKNHEYFMVRALGPTPVQVLNSGGDCSDKSRLLSAMLREIGIDSGLIMVYPCPTCDPIHTVVEAEYDRGKMVVDPIWNVDYPAGGGRYYGVRDMAGTARGPAHIAELKQQAPQSAKIWRMPDEEATFTYAAGINWNKNRLTKLTASTLRRLRIEPSDVFRPNILEDPKLALWIFLGSAAASVLTIGILIRALEKRLRRAA